MSTNQTRFAVTAGVLLLLAGCSPSPERARAKIEAAGLTFDENGLGRAVLAADTEALELFLTAGYDVTTFDDPKKAPLMLAARNTNLAAMELLIEAGARAEGLPGVLVIPAMRPETERLSLLLDAGAEVDAADQTGRTAMLAAIEIANKDAVRLLLDHGANPDGLPHPAFSRRGHNPLIQAVMGDRSEIVDMLIEGGANVDATSGRTTALIAAARSGNNEMIDRLLAAGADPSLTSSGVTAAQAATRAGNHELAERLAGL